MVGRYVGSHGGAVFGEWKSQCGEIGGGELWRGGTSTYVEDYGRASKGTNLIIRCRIFQTPTQRTCQ